MNSLTNEEINQLIQKIRREYSEFGKLNPKLFPILPFEERYSHALKTKSNLAIFINEEVKFLEKLKSIHEENKKKAEIKKSPTINRILDEHEKLLEKYPRIFINSDVRNELNYFYGAIVNFVDNELQLLIKLFKGTPEMKLFADSIAQLEKLGHRINGKNSIRIQAHIDLIVSVKSDKSQIEQDTQLILKDTCISLKNIVVSLNHCLNKKLISVERILHIRDDMSPEMYKKYNAVPIGEAIKNIKNLAINIIKDFRMAEIVGDIS